MGCNCGAKKRSASFKVRLPGGLTVSKSSEDEAKKFAAKHPGSKIIKPAS